MPVKKLRFLLLSFALVLPTISFAASFPCDQSSLCDTQTQSTLPDNAVQTKSVADSANTAQKFNSVAELINQLDLSKEQSLVLYDVIKQQMPEVSKNRKNIDQAQATLRNMAINKQFDETVIGILAKTIAENTANLAILQVQREYEVLAILTPEQIKRYQDLTSQ